MTKTLNNEVSSNASNAFGESIYISAELRPLAVSEQDLVDAYITCRQKCSNREMKLCDGRGIMPGMEECKETI